MNYRRKIFTTDPAFHFSFDHINEVQSLAKGLTHGRTDWEYIDIKELKTKKHKSGRNIIDHDWFQEHLTAKAPGYSSVGLHLRNKDRSRLRIDGSVKGQHIGDRDDVNEYFVCASTQKDFDRRVLHEEGHEFETKDNVLHYYAMRGDYEGFYSRVDVSDPPTLLDLLKAKLALLRLQLDKLFVPMPIYPLEHWTVSNPFAAKDSTTKSKIHNGVDHPCPIGTPVRAMVNGFEVYQVFRLNPSMGNACYVRFVYEGKQYHARFMHLSSVPAKGVYNRGDIFAYTGQSGRSTGPHLHWELWKVPVNTALLSSKASVLANLLDPVAWYQAQVS